MAEHPLLIFPEPAFTERAKRPRGGGKFRFPPVNQQAARLTPQFRRLQEAMNRQRLALQNNTLGLQPEQVLVLETVGPIQDFIKAVRRITGLEWLGELEVDDIIPDYGFEDEKDPSKHLKGQLFLVMTDQRALQNLQHLFRRWQRNPSAKFTRGLSPWKHAFEHLHNIRTWNMEDRLRDTGLLEDWQLRIQGGQEVIPFEVELFFHANQERRILAESYLLNLINSLGGSVVQQCIIPEIAYHGILGRIPSERITDILEQRDVRLFHCKDIMYMRPVGQCAVFLPVDISESEAYERQAPQYIPAMEPIVALLDGLPLTRHRLLDGRIILDDPDGYEGDYQARERVHGTAMASLICHGDLCDNGESIKRPIYVRPIMQPYRGSSDQFDERVPEGVLPIDLVHRAVRRLFEKEGAEEPVAPSIRVINLSVCDRARQFDRGISSWARLLDWLSWKYKVLFVVSAGNHAQDIELDVQRTYLSNLSAEELEKKVIKAIAADTRNRRLLSPAETLNGLTIGASHSDMSTFAYNSNLLNPFTRKEIPSTLSAHGPGYRRAIKPDIFFPGGRLLLSEKLGNIHDNAILQKTMLKSPPGHQVATPNARGELNGTMYTRGTSNSAALASRSASFLYDVMEDLRVQQGVTLPSEFDAILLKLLLVHGAEWGEAGPLYESIMLGSQNARLLKDYIARFLGYGRANMAKAKACTDNRATALGIGELADGEAHEFNFPLPPSLSALVEKRRLTITLAWFTPIDCSRQNYRIAHLWFDPKNNLAPLRVDADYRSVTRGSLQHEVLEGSDALDFQDGEAITVKVNCRADAGEILDPIPYGLAVSLEVAEEINIPIYQEVRDRLRIRIPVIGRGTA